MANYVPSNLVKAQAKITQLFNANELKFRVPALFMEFIKNTEIMVPSHKILRTREDRTVDVEYFARSARSLTTTGRVHNGSFTKGDSATLTPTWTPYSDGFKYSIKQADNNVFAIEEMLRNELINVYGNFAEGLDGATADYLLANRSTANAYSAQGTFNATNDVFEITETTNGDRAFQITKTVMDFAKFQGIPYVVFCDTVAYDKFEKQFNQAQANSENLSFQFGNARIVKGVDIDTDAAALTYTKGFWYAVPQGMIASLDWIPMQNRNGVNMKEGKYSSIINPVDGLNYAVFEYEAREDGSSDNGYKQDIAIQTEISIDIALEHAPQAATSFGTSPIFAFANV